MKTNLLFIPIAAFLFCASTAEAHSEERASLAMATEHAASGMADLPASTEKIPAGNPGMEETTMKGAGHSTGQRKRAKAADRVGAEAQHDEKPAAGKLTWSIPASSDVF